MRKITFSEATREAMAEEMEKYPECFVMGEDIARQGGIFGQFKGLPAEFPGRVIDTPISETFIVGGGVGAALAGAREKIKKAKEFAVACEYPEESEFLTDVYAD